MGLTKLASSVVMDMLREAMPAKVPAVADPTTNVTQQDANRWGCMLRAFAALRSVRKADLATSQPGELRTQLPP